MLDPSPGMDSPLATVQAKEWLCGGRTWGHGAQEEPTFLAVRVH